MINQAAEFVGIVFDGNIQSLVGDFIYDETQNRAVSVHSSHHYRGDEKDLPRRSAGGRTGHVTGRFRSSNKATFGFEAAAFQRQPVIGLVVGRQPMATKEFCVRLGDVSRGKVEHCFVFDFSSLAPSLIHHLDSPKGELGSGTHRNVI